MPQTLVLTSSELQRAVDLRALAAELRSALRSYESDGQAQRVGAVVSADVSAMVLLPGMAPGVPAYTVKVHAKRPTMRPAVSGVMCLHDLGTGDLLAILDSGWLTAARTGVGAALGTDVLANPDACDVGIIGAGAQGRAQLRALAALRPIAAVRVHDHDAVAAGVFAETIGPELGIPVQVVADARGVAVASDVLLVATWSRRPVLTGDHVRPRTHITSLGADEPGKLELPPELLAAALVVSDDERLAARVLPRVDTTLSQVLRREHPGRQSEDELTVYSPVGLPMQDCVSAWHAYERASSLGFGRRTDLQA